MGCRLVQIVSGSFLNGWVLRMAARLGSGCAGSIPASRPVTNEFAAVTDWKRKSLQSHHQEVVSYRCKSVRAHVTDGNDRRARLLCGFGGDNDLPDWPPHVDDEQTSPFPEEPRCTITLASLRTNPIPQQ